MKKGSKLEKKKKMSLFADGIMTDIENPKDAIRKLLEHINDFSNIAGYQINIQQSLAFLYMDNKRPEGAIQETITSIIASKIIR